MSECEKWLFEYLNKYGWRLVQDVYEDGKAKGFKKAEIKAAKKKLGFKTHHQFDEEGATENWFWHTDDNHWFASKS